MKTKKIILHGQEVEVTVYDRPKRPHIAEYKYLDEIPGASVERIAEIKKIVDEYKEAVIEHELLREDPYSDFLTLVPDVDNPLEMEGFGTIEESVKPLDKLLEEVGFEK